MPDPGRLEELLATGIGQCPTKRHQFAAVRAIQALKRVGRSLQLPPLGVGHPEYLIPSHRQLLAVYGDASGLTKRRDRCLEFLGILSDIGLRLRRRRPPRRGISALGHGLEKSD